MDIGGPEVLRRLLPDAFAQGTRTADSIRDFGYAVTSQRGPITTAAHRQIRQWHQDWLALGADAGLTVVTGSTTLGGAAALDRFGGVRPTSPDRRRATPTAAECRDQPGG